jgi:hypothetical protein
MPLQRDCPLKLKKLTEPKEEVVIRHILDLNLRGFPPSFSAVRVIANKLLAKRSARLVSRL